MSGDPFLTKAGTRFHFLPALTRAWSAGARSVRCLTGSFYGTLLKSARLGVHRVIRLFFHVGGDRDGRGLSEDRSAV